MILNMILPGTAGGAGEEPFGFTYSGNFTDNRNADGKGTVRLNTSGTLSVISGTATVIATIVGAGGGAAYMTYAQYRTGDTGGGGGGVGYTGNTGGKGGSGIILIRFPEGTELAQVA